MGQDVHIANEVPTLMVSSSSDNLMSVSLPVKGWSTSGEIDSPHMEIVREQLSCSCASDTSFHGLSQTCLLVIEDTDNLSQASSGADEVLFS